jgi:hypothetical protein
MDGMTTEAPMTQRAFVGGATLGSASRLPRNEAVARERSAIESELGTGHQVQAILHETISELESKISPVRSNHPPTDGDRPGREMLGNSTFYTTVYEQNNTTVSAIERLRTLIRELEV